MGVGRHIEYLLRAWSRQELPFEEVRVFSPEPLADAPEDERFSYHFGGGKTGMWWQLSDLRRGAADVDVLFSAYTTPPGYRGKSVVLNLGIYEGRFAMPGWRSRLRSRHFAWSGQRADAVIANSASTKSDLVSFYGLPEEKIRVILPGAHEGFRPPRPDEGSEIANAVKRLVGGWTPYFLFVGKFSPRRNVPALLKAFEQVHQEHPEFRLVLVGADADNNLASAAAEQLRRSGAIRHIPHLEQDDLALLYRGARAFVLPTEHEGISYTISEALLSGCPVITLNHTPLAERGMDRAVLTLPDAQPTTLARALLRLAEDDELRSDLAARSRRCAEGFQSMDQHARSVMGIIAHVASGEQ